MDMKRKRQFLRSVQILAPGDTFFLNAAQSVPEESLPVAPGGAALDLVVAMQKLMRSANDNSCARNWKGSEHPQREGQDQLSVNFALRVQSAHY
jgi:hypothetical protein